MVNEKNSQIQNELETNINIPQPNPSGFNIDMNIQSSVNSNFIDNLINKNPDSNLGKVSLNLPYAYKKTLDKEKDNEIKNLIKEEN